MGNCKSINFLFKLIPFKFLQYFLLQSHVSKCEACQNALVRIHEARSVTISKDSLEKKGDFRPRFVEDLEEQKKKTWN